MGVANVPAASAGGGINSVQRGSAAGSGNVTITAVDVTKSFVTVFGSASSGTVAASGAISGANGSFNGMAFGGNASNHNSATTNLALNATNLSGGTNNLVAAQVTGFLADATTLTVSGACRYEVVEFA
jgi:hypothetical protein